MDKSDSTARGFADKPNKPYPKFPLFPQGTSANAAIVVLDG